MNHKSITGSGLLLLLIILVGCRQGSQQQGWNQGPAELPIAIVEQGKATVPREYSASIEGVTNVEIRPQVSGYLSRILVDEGDYVKAGQTLFRIEDRPYAEQLNSAKASLLTAQSAVTTAKIDLERKKELVKSRIVSELQLQEAEATYNGARAAVEQASSMVNSAKINLEFCTIKAPVSGYISRIPYRLGSLVAPANGEPLTFLSDINRVNVYFSLSENDFVAFQKLYGGNANDGKLAGIPPVTLLLSDGQPYEVPGKIDAIDGQFNKATGSITLRARFDNPKSVLRSGNTGKVVLEQHYADAVLFPVASTITIQDKVFVFSLDKEDKAVQLPIEVSGKAGNNYIVSDGIKSGDRYIVSGFDRLQAGTPVTAQKTEPENKQQ
ncbi:efflux RND transporter periplasmic adaptor subunit [Sphingobacterium daejeonense]|uniref:efflux RND transporter periplasmic adaptor subunit n=1 Tax=Sphingobacterium daejeonense TaxID=371142 RepID=UPI0010C3C30C|nr:efflux RND transporter periplasmic adaptor subunit [Sphingobacterium daejeonense]VTP91692.1 Multidrug resistance protein MdtE precursor [Sphingobacterium daejeonense]